MKNVTSTELLQYLQSFHTTLQDTADRYLPSHLARRLTHLAPLPARVVGYLSTQHGIAIDYDPPTVRSESDVTSFDVIVGSSRAEELVLRHGGAPKAMFRNPPAFTVNGGRIEFSGIGFWGAVRVNGNAEVVFKHCGFQWKGGGKEWSLGTARLEVYGQRSASHWSIAMAVERAKEEVLSALFELERANKRGISLKEYYREHREQVVLVLGSYSQGGLARLRRIERRLQDLGYEPVLICDVPDQAVQTLEQKVVMVGSLSRFVVLDDSEKSGHLSELTLCKANGWITIVLRPGGVPSSAMSAAASVLSNVILEQSYDPASIEDPLPESLKWAEIKRKEIGVQLRTGYPWSKPPNGE